MKSAKGKRKYRWVVECLPQGYGWIRSTCNPGIGFTEKEAKREAKFLDCPKIRYRARRVAV